MSNALYALLFFIDINLYLLYNKKMRGDNNGFIKEESDI